MNKKQKSIDRIFIGLGGAGNNLLYSLQTETDLISDTEKCFFVNFSKTDLSNKFKGVHLLVGSSKVSDGTGKSIQVGQDIIKKHIKTITGFQQKIYKNHLKDIEERKDIVILSSLGGGTGSSLTPVFLDFFGRANNADVIYFPILSSRKEGISTLPNVIKNFHNIYNNFILKNIPKATFLIDNELFEKTLNIDMFDFNSMNKEIAYWIEKVLEREKHASSSEGMVSLDINEKNRVFYYGNGLTDFCEMDLSEGEEIKMTSSIFSERYKWSTAKAVYVNVVFDTDEKNLTDSLRKYANDVVKKVHKKFGESTFFVYGFSFNNSDFSFEKDLLVEVMINGLEYPQTFQRNVNKALKEVEKIKKQHKEFDEQKLDKLDF